jgi:WD40 repeat protein
MTRDQPMKLFCAWMIVACAACVSLAAPPKFDAVGDPLPPGALLRLGSLRFRHPGTVVDMALSPDEKTIVTIGSEELIAWDAKTGKALWRADSRLHGINLPGAAYGLRALAFLPDGRLVTPGLDNEIILWDVASGRNEAVFVAAAPPAQGHLQNWRASGPMAVDVSPDGERFAVGGAMGVVVCERDGRVLFQVENRPQGDVEINDMNTDRLLFGGHSSCGQFSPDGDVLAVVTSDSPDEIRLLDAQSGEELRRIKLEARLVRLAFSPDGARIAATERDSTVRLYDVATGDRVWSRVIELTNPYENYTSAIAFTPDGATIAACATDNRIYELDAENGDVTGRLEGHTWYPWALAYTSDGAKLYSSGWDGPVRRWDVASQEQLPLPQGVRATGVVALAPDGATVAYEDDAGKVRLVDVASGEERRVLEMRDAQFSQLVFSPDGAQLAGGGTVRDGVQVVVWNLANGEVVHQWDWPKGRDPHSEVEALAFSPDGSRLAAAVFRQSMAYWWNLETGKQIAKREHEEIYGLSISPDGQTLATVGWDSRLRLWAVDSGDLNYEVNVGNEQPGAGAADDLRMYAVSYATHGGLFATQHMNGEVWVRDATSLKPVTKMNSGDRFGYGSLSFAPNGLWVAVGSSSGEVSLCDAWSGESVWVAEAHEDTIYATGFSRDGRRLVTGADDGVCYLWDLYPEWTPLHEEVEALWTDLAGDNSQAAFQAYLELADQPQRTIPLIAEKLRGVHTLLDPNQVEEETSEEEARRMRRLGELLVKRDPSVERPLAARRAVALLVQFDSPESRTLLEELAAEHPEGDLGPLAKAALRELDSANPGQR